MTTILVFLAFICLYGSICFYIGVNGWGWLKATFSFKYKKSYIAVISFLSISFFASFALSSPLLEMVGGYWLVVVGYSLLLLPIANLIYFVTKKKRKWKMGLGWTIVIFFMFVFIYGSFNAWTPVVREYDIAVDKEVKGKNKELKILMASDLHLGTIVGNNHLEKLVKIVNDERPDIIFLPGDIINDDITSYVEEEMRTTMEKLAAPLGVYATPGNHDYYGGDNEDIKAELEDIGIPFLMDEVTDIEGQLTIIGREDYSNRDRKSLELLLKDVDMTQPVIVLDHQPREITKTQKLGVDMIFSGHTHRGQLAPAHLITQRMYENDWGYLKKEQLHSFTSSGFGLWGPALRIGSQSEVMVINVTFN
ncbi:metallophosphoesterase [Cytobacillus purgationiresistens]|uniref:MPP superfamily phosphohydrolase n=1 Tax=Cytobacillus purgationiresistens TaxID=863449 RepID=A0ABU0AAC0_9BACI|nr:metallophosphoesterase [Cytobacillus purgationiresistens]MDQ0268195.1 putative MPP superfamily phosphohydrolase [Cytobacillus purgationiresistens]